MRHPLTDLPLDKFVVTTEQRVSTKRPLSPGATLLSPSKRRLLSVEGLYSPEKKRNSTTPKQLFSQPAGSSSSPARKLDFTKLSHPFPRKISSTAHTRGTSPRPETPVTSAGSTLALAPSPEILANSSVDASTSRIDLDAAPDSVSTHSLPPPMRIPREMPILSDCTSYHWPGFDVHLDTHIVIATAQSTIRRVDAPEADDTKENVRPNRRAGKRMTLNGAEPGKSVRSGRTERQIQEAGINIMSLGPLPRTHSMTPQERQQGRSRMRLIMELEMDEEADVDDQL